MDYITQHPKPEILNLKLCTLNSKSETLNSNSEALNSKSETLHPDLNPNADAYTAPVALEIRRSKNKNMNSNSTRP